MSVGNVGGNGALEGGEDGVATGEAAQKPHSVGAGLRELARCIAVALAVGGAVGRMWTGNVVVVVVGSREICHRQVDLDVLVS